MEVCQDGINLYKFGYLKKKSYICIMKKLLIFVLFGMLLCGCDNTHDIIGLKKGDIRTTETEHYILIERYNWTNAYGREFWDYVRIISKDSIKTKENEH